MTLRRSRYGGKGNPVAGVWGPAGEYEKGEVR